MRGIESESKAKWMERAEALLESVRSWALTRDDIKALLLVGSYARGEAREDSDVDLVVLADQPNRYIVDPAFVEAFGSASRIERESWGKVTSLRVWYDDGLEVEFGISTPDWVTDDPLDSGTVRVLSDGARVLVDRVGGLDELVSSITAAVSQGS